MKYIKGFDGLRAFSIILVLLSHLNIRQQLPEYQFFQERFWRLISGETGVLIFFNLSGFLITLILLQEKMNSGKIHFKLFFIKRFLRLLPPFLLFSFSVLVLKAYHYLDYSTEGFLFSFFYLYNYVPTAYYHNELVHTWSLAVEEQFYLIWPFVIQFFTLKKIISFIFLLIIASIILFTVFKLGGFRDYRRPDRWFIPASSSILIGSFIALSIHYKIVKVTSKIKSNYAFVLGMILYLSPLFTLKFFLYLSPLIQSIGTIFIIGWIFYHQQSKLTNFLNNKLLNYIGKISYGIYVYQGLFLGTGHSSNLFFQQFPQNIIFTLIIAILSFEFMEKPILKMKRKFSDIKSLEGVS
jgi:peptidoglycan/LPS O-acetylase OafA/YrhL